MIVQRRHFKRFEPLEGHLAQRALRLGELSHAQGFKRERLDRRARQCENGSHSSEWLRSHQ